MTLRGSPLNTREKACLVTKLLADQPGATEGDCKSLFVWAENVRAAAAILDGIEADELQIRITVGGRVKVLSKRGHM